MVRLLGGCLLLFSALACSRGDSQDAKPGGPIPEVTAKPFDWPQWQGPQRTAQSKETGLLPKWDKKDGPPLAWKVKGLGAGFSTPSVSAGRIFTMGNKDKVEYVIALKEADGSELWAKAMGPERSEGGGHPGPRCTPTVDGGRVYALGINGDLVCLDVNGAELWRKDLQSKEYGGSPGGWGYCESPLIDGDTLVVTPGGKNTFLALDKTNGKTLWIGQVPKGESAGYSSIAAGTINGQRQYVQFLSRGVVGFSADKGEFLWRYNKPANGTANISTPIIHDNQVFAASGYGTGGGLVKIEKSEDKSQTAEQVYFTTDMQNHHGGMVLLDGYLYGSNGGQLACLKWDTGDVAWQSGKPGKGSIAYADGCLYYRNEGGTVVLVKATPKEYVELGRFQQPDRSRKSAWAHPVIANGKLYIADQDLLFCYDVKQKS